jgi:hypothetical protein
MMTEDRDRHVQDWFGHSVEELPGQSFTLAVLERVRRTERRLQRQRSAAIFVAFSSFCVLLPELIGLLNMLATLPLAVVEVGGEQWPLLVLIVLAIAYWLVKYTRNRGFKPYLMWNFAGATSSEK